MDKDLELYKLVRHALMMIRNTPLGLDEAKDSYALCDLVEARIKELTLYQQLAQQHSLAHASSSDFDRVSDILLRDN